MRQHVYGLSSPPGEITVNLNERVLVAVGNWIMVNSSDTACDLFRFFKVNFLEMKPYIT